MAHTWRVNPPLVPFLALGAKTQIGSASGVREARGLRDDVGADGDDDLRDDRLHGAGPRHLDEYRVLRRRPRLGRGAEQPRECVTDCMCVCVCVSFPLIVLRFDLV